MKNSLLFLLFLIGMMSSAFAVTDICNIEITPDARASAFSNGEYVNVNIDYSTDEVDGIRIFARPFTNGDLTPEYSAAGSTVLFGSGTKNSNFTITQGNVLVDEIRITVFNGDQSELLYRMYIPVHFSFGTTGVNHFTFSDDPDLSSLLLNETFTTTFEYNVSYPGGILVFIRPFTDGNLTPNYSASGSNTYTGTGAASSNFTFDSGNNIHVDALRVRIMNTDQSVIIDEFFIPVNLHFSTTKITDIVPEAGMFPFNNEDREIVFNYSTTEAAGVLIFLRPWTNGLLTTDYTASGSLLYMDSGTGSGSFSVASGNQRVDHVRFRVTNSDQSEVLLEMFYPVEYTFGNFLVRDIVLCPSPPARLEHGTNVKVNYNYHNDEGVNTLVFVRPFSNGVICPDYSASGSQTYPAGLGSASDNFTLNSGNVLVDQIRFQVKTEDQSTILAEYFIPVQYQYGEATVATSNPDNMVEAIQLYPNPATDGTTLMLQLNQNQRVHASILNLTGQYVQDLGARDVAAGHPEVWQIDGTNLSSGLYLIQVESDAFTTTRKLIISKE